MSIIVHSLRIIMLSFENISDLLKINNNNISDKMLNRQTYPGYASHIV